jgi:hypothetical protein
MSKSNYAENKTLDWCVGRPVAQITAYVALFTAAPSDTTAGTEVTGAGYARKATIHGSDWGVATNGSISNIANIDFPLATSDYSAPVTHWGILDALTGGNLIRWAALTDPKTISAGETPRFSAGTLVLNED